MRLFLGENSDEVVVISNTFTSKKFKQLIIAITWLCNVDNVFSLRPRDTSCSSELSDKCTVGVNAVQQLNTIDSQLAYMSFIQRSNIAVLSSDICTLT